MWDSGRPVWWATGWLTSLGRASHLPTVPTLAILTSPVYPVVPHKGWLVEERSELGEKEQALSTVCTPQFVRDEGGTCRKVPAIPGVR